jgi:MFS family permease
MTNSLSHTEPMPRVDVRVRISALWTATMFLFAYVDLFSLYRSDVQAALEAGTVSIFEVGQPFLLGVVAYVAIPSLMIYLSLVLPRRANRIVNIVAAAVYAITIVGAAIGDWGYYLLGSFIEGALLLVVILHAWKWRAPAGGAKR